MDTINGLNFKYSKNHIYENNNVNIQEKDLWEMEITFRTTPLNCIYHKQQQQKQQPRQQQLQ